MTTKRHRDDKPPNTSSGSESPSPPPGRTQALELAEINQIWDAMKNGIYSYDVPQREQLKNLLHAKGRMYNPDPPVVPVPVAPVPVVDWLQPTAPLVARDEYPFRYWGEYRNEVFLVLPSSSAMMVLGWRRRHPIECCVTVEEIQHVIGDLYCPGAAPQEEAGSHVEPVVIDTPCHPHIKELYLRFLKKCGIAREEEEDDHDYNLWTPRSLMRRRIILRPPGPYQRQFDLKESFFNKQLRVTFADIERFVRLPPNDRNLQNFINQNRIDFIERQKNSDTFGPYLQYRNDITLFDLEQLDAADAAAAAAAADDADDADDAAAEMGGKRRKPATKRKARRRSASSKRKPTSAAKRRRTATIKSKRTRRTRVRRATRRN